MTPERLAEIEQKHACWQATLDNKGCVPSGHCFICDLLKERDALQQRVEGLEKVAEELYDHFRRRFDGLRTPWTDKEMLERFVALRGGEMG